MTRRIFRAICAAALAVFLATMTMILGVLYDCFSALQQNRLSHETALVVRGLERMGRPYLEDLPMEGRRISWIAPDGTVLYDSASNSDDMENHLEREEVRAALAHGRGESARHSSTLLERSLYCAQRLEDGTVLRLSVAHESILRLLLGLARPALGMIAVAVLLSFLLARGLARRIVTPLNGLNLDDPLENEGYDELSPLLRRIHSQQRRLAAQDATLRRKTRELDIIIGSMEEGMLLLDAGNTVLTMNAAAQALLGIPGMCAGGNILKLARCMALHEAIRRASGGAPCTVRTELKGRIVRISASPLHADDGVSGTAVVLFDITQREKAEQRRREFTANVSHELKIPLHAISGYSELLKCGIVRQEDVQEFSEKIYDETQRLIALVEDIISLSRLDEGCGDMGGSEVDLRGMAEDVVRDMAAAAHEHGIAISVEGGRCVVSGIPKLIRAMICNLCDNAVKYNRPGGSVAVRVEGRGFSVRDTGIGIPQEHLDRIFERFYRVDRSHSKAVGGTGLGLSIVKHAAKIHGAEIAVSSVVGEGSAVTITFPETAVRG